MGQRKKKSTPPSQIDAETWAKVGRWIADRVDEMEGDAASISVEEGRDFLPALRGIAAHLTAGGTLDSRARV
jgi:hypothetical protein